MRLDTLIFIRRGSQVLLGMKKRGMGVNWWNGFGGKVEAGEGIETAARRELVEESGLKADTVTHCGVLTFHIGKDKDIECHVFLASAEGEPVETEEMRPQWFPEDAIPYDQMWPSDRAFIPLVLAGKMFRGEFSFTDDWKLIEGS